MAKRDTYQEVTNKIIQALEKGVGPWIRPWRTAGQHRNAFTGRPYRGINSLLLNLAQWEGNYDYPLWLTYREAKKLGGHIRKGEKGTTVVFWKILEVPEVDPEGLPVFDADTGEQIVKRIPLIRHYTVFNIAQCEGLDYDRIALPDVLNTHSPDETVEEAERILSLPRIGVWGDRAYYDRFQDIIVLPHESRFLSKNHYYATALHETVHWSGHESRLNRQFGERFGDQAYAFEELVAEMGSAFLCAQVGIELDRLQHPEYINNWLQVLRNDKKAVFTAARKAQEAVDWLLEEAGLKPKVEDLELAA